jgi:hypothetical protein
MSTAFLISIPIMLLAIVVAVAPVLVTSVHEHRRSQDKRSRINPPAPIGPVATSPTVEKRNGDARAAVIVLEEAAFAVNRLRAHREVTAGADVDQSLRRASNDLHRALVSLGAVDRG